MSKAFAWIAIFTAGALFADAAPPLDKSITSVEKKSSQTQSNFKSFTGKTVGNNVRMRSLPDLDSHIISELTKGDYVVVTAEKGDFYAVAAPTELKAYIFRGFVIDNVVEGERVNIRLFPEREAPIIGHYSTGHVLEGKVCKDNSKWLEIPIPSNTQFFVAKEYIEYAGKPELKKIHDKRKTSVAQLFNSTQLLSQSELHKAFHEIDIERITQGYQTIIQDYVDFPDYVALSAKALSEIQEDYLHRKIAFLEAKASKMGKGQVEDIYEVSHRLENAMSPTDRMKIWEPIEQAVYHTWSSKHHAKTMDDFYEDQKMKCQNISGILTPYRDPVKNKPGDYVIMDRDIPVAFVYSVQINLEEHVNKRVNLMVSPRPNNNFAFPAYYVHHVE